MENSEYSPQEITVEKRFPKIKEVKDFDVLLKLSKEENSREVGMGEYLKIEEDIVYSFGANPCLIALTINKQGDFHLSHSLGRKFNLKQMKILEEAVKGIVGGGKETILEHSEMFKKKNFKVISPNNSNDDFNVVILRKKIPNFIPSGIYYYYGNIKEEELEENYLE